MEAIRKGLSMGQEAYAAWRAFWRGEFTLRKALVVSLGLHVVLFLAMLIGRAGGQSLDLSPVELYLPENFRPKRIIAADPRESAPGTEKETADGHDKGQRGERRMDRRSSDTDRTKPRDYGRRDTGDPDYTRLSRETTGDFSFSRMLDPSRYWSGRTALGRDSKSKPGSRTSLGRDDSTRTTRDGNPADDSSLKPGREGDQGRGVQGTANVRGRKVVFRPSIALPARYEELGLTFTVVVNVTVSPEGIVITSRAQSVGESELERILEQKARNFRFEAVAGGGNQEGSIAFVISPR